MANIAYRIIPADPAGHYFEVTLSIDKPAPQGQLLSLPAWIPGSYMIRDFARHIFSLRAHAADQQIGVKKLDKQTWQLDPIDGPVSVVYRVYAWDLSVRAAHLDITHGYFNGPSVFLRVIGQETETYRLDIEPPSDPLVSSWCVATALSVVSVNQAGFGTYRADDYEELIDHPVEMGRFEEIVFDVKGIQHAMVVSGRVAVDALRLRADLERICRQHLALFGDPAPIDRYLFLTMAVGDGYGGLEHRRSTSLMCNRDDLPAVGLELPTEGYRRFLGLCSHEYFHLWHVKRIRPERLQSADLSCEVHTNLLWAFEGITSYYDELALVRSRCIACESYLELVAQNVTRVMRGTGRSIQSIAESSFDAWTKFYKQDENAPNAIVSYYAKGGLVAFGLDMELRNRTAESVCLDDLMRALWEQFGRPGIGVPEDGVERLANELAATDLSVFFERYVHGTDELPLVDWFASVGVGFVLRAARGPDDQGGCTDNARTPGVSPLALGARTRGDGPFAEITHVYNGGAAHNAGLSAGDRIVALDGIQVKPESLSKRIEQGREGAAIAIHAFRRDELMTFDLFPQHAVLDTCDLWLVDESSLTVTQKNRRAAWLSGID